MKHRRRVFCGIRLMDIQPGDTVDALQEEGLGLDSQMQIKNDPPLLSCDGLSIGGDSSVQLLSEISDLSEFDPNDFNEIIKDIEAVGNGTAPPDGSCFHEHLSQDIRLAEEQLRVVETIIDKKCIGYFFNPTSYTWELTLCIPLSVVNSQFREWWGLTDSFLRVELLNFNVKLFRRRDPPSVSSSLPSSSIRNVATQAIDNACKAFLEKTWLVAHEDDMDPYEEDRGSYFVRLIGFIVGRLKELGNFCVQCGKKQLGAHPLLTVCDQALCVFQRDLLRKNLGESSGPRLWSDSAELLILLFGYANMASRKKHVFNPDPRKDLKTTKRGIESLLKGWCTRCAFTTWNSFNLFRESRPDLSNLLYWLSDRFPVVCRLPPRFRIDELITRNQYLLPPVPSPKEERFRRAKGSVGGKTFFALHGSPIQNWYSIMCEGLQVCSGTDIIQSDGESYGDGIYLAQEARTSNGWPTLFRDTDRVRLLPREYCDVDTHKEESADVNAGIWCIGLCEVVDDPSKFSAEGDGDPYYVLTDPDYVQVRALFVYASDYVSQLRVEEENLSIGGSIHTKLLRALSFFSEAGFRERIAAVLDSNGDNAIYPDDGDLLRLPVNEQERGDTQIPRAKRSRLMNLDDNENSNY